MITADEFFGALEDIQYHMDEPQSNLSSVPLWFLAEMARKDVTVVLSGEGADELFGGYAYYEDTVPVLSLIHILVPRLRASRCGRRSLLTPAPRPTRAR